MRLVVMTKTEVLTEVGRLKKKTVKTTISLTAVSSWRETRTTSLTSRTLISRGPSKKEVDEEETESDRIEKKSHSFTARAKQ